MIKHIVLFKLADHAEGKSKAENALLIKEQLEALKQTIKEIRKITVYINDATISTENHDIMLESEFDNIDDLNKYMNHPEHLKVGEYLSKVRVSRAAIDFQF